MHDHTRLLPPGMTRDCLDPWVYVEFRVDGRVSLCCVRRPIGNLAKQTVADILNSEEARSLRHALLSGSPDGVCRACGLRGVTTPSALQDSVRAMQTSVDLPEGFDKAAYLEANQDVKEAGEDAALHYKNWGRLEGRPLNTR